MATRSRSGKLAGARLLHRMVLAAGCVLLRRAPPSQAGLQMQTGNSRLNAALEQLILLIEQQLPAMQGSVLLLDEDGLTLHHAAGPNLPAEYIEHIDGSRIGPAA